MDKGVEIGRKETELEMTSNQCSDCQWVYRGRVGNFNRCERDARGRSGLGSLADLLSSNRR